MPRPYGFPKKDAEDIIRSLQESKLDPGPELTRAAWDLPSDRRFFLAKTAETIAEGAFGNAAVQQINSNGGQSDTQLIIPVYNPWPGTIATDRLIACHEEDATGYFVITTEACP